MINRALIYGHTWPSPLEQAALACGRLCVPELQEGGWVCGGHGGFLGADGVQRVSPTRGGYLAQSFLLVFRFDDSGGNFW